MCIRDRARRGRCASGAAARPCGRLARVQQEAAENVPVVRPWHTWPASAHRSHRHAAASALAAHLRGSGLCAVGAAAMAISSGGRRPLLPNIGG
eukprot:9203834-Lingulodinium_polyedra.AAC.1